MPFSLDRPVA